MNIKPSHISLFTATGAENLGDELITLTEVQHLQRIYPDSCITVFSHDTARTKRFLLSQNISLNKVTIQEYFPNFLRKKPLKNIRLFWETLRLMRDSDHIYIGGGWLLYAKSEEGHSPLRLWSLRARLAKFFKKPITYLSLGISAEIDELRPFSRAIFAWTEITVRDKKSQETVNQLWFEAKILPDPVLSYTPEQRPKTKTIGIAFRKWFLSDTIVREICQKLSSLSYEILFLPHSLHPTDEASHDGYYLQDFLSPSTSTTQTIEQTLQAYRKCHILLSMRLHSMILAVDHHIPFIGVSYGKKTQYLLEDLDWKYAHTSDVSAAQIIEDIYEIENHYTELEKKLAQKHLSYQTLYTNSFPWK